MALLERADPLIEFTQFTDVARLGDEVAVRTSRHRGIYIGVTPFRVERIDPDDPFALTEIDAFRSFVGGLGFTTWLVAA